MLIDLLVDLAVKAMHGHTVVTYKAGTRNAYMTTILKGWWDLIFHYF